MSYTNGLKRLKQFLEQSQKNNKELPEYVKQSSEKIMNENNFPSWVYRWRIALALCGGTLIGGVMLDVLHLQPVIASSSAAGVTAAIFFFLRK
jgi:hypothetical protein